MASYSVDTRGEIPTLIRWECPYIYTFCPLEPTNGSKVLAKPACSGVRETSFGMTIFPKRKHRSIWIKSVKQ